MRDDIKREDKIKMYKSIAKDVCKTLVLALVVLGVLLLVYKDKVVVSSPSIIIGTIGTVLIFIGGIFTSDALGRYGAKGLPQFKWGTRMQAVGLSFTIVALLIK